MAMPATRRSLLHFSSTSIFCQNSSDLHLLHFLRYYHDSQFCEQQPIEQESPQQAVQFCDAEEESILDKIKSCYTKTHLKNIHAYLLGTNSIQKLDVLTPFLSQTTKVDMDYSLQIFSQNRDPSVALCNVILRGYSKSMSPEDAFYFYREMRRRGLHPSAFSSSFVINSCHRVQSLFGGRQIHAVVLRDGQQCDSLLLTSLMSLYASCGRLEEAYILFDEMPHRDTVAWNVLISCYAENNRTRDALALFEAMQATADDCEPDGVTCLLILQACAHLGALKFGEQIHGYINKHGFSSALKLCNSLIDMYSKCGFVDEAFGVFMEMDVRNVVTWSAMISGLAMNGHGKEAINAFREMQRVGISPDEQTFTGVLSACSHSSLVHEGWEIFDVMRSEFGLVPNIHHYGCMVDLLGRAGLLDQAYGLIRSMVVQPDATIWRTLLGACRIHGHVALGERIVNHLIELKAQEAGDYVLLLNIYASAGNWEKVADVRRLMKDKGIQTQPGGSTIEVKGKIHEFVVDDDSHPLKKEIYEKLYEIGSQLRIAGYVAEMSAELHHSDMEKRESALSFHSEKLAIAFGVLSTPPGTTLRIAKNLRTCIDCHTFAKFVSSVYNRTLVIRDRNRFHHFRDGSCSCKDYW